MNSKLALFQNIYLIKEQKKTAQNLWHNLWHKNEKAPEILMISGVMVESGGLEPSTFRV